MGARVATGALVRRRWSQNPADAFSIDVKDDRKGEFFEILVRPGADVDVDVIHIEPKDRHLLLMVKEPDDSARSGRGSTIHKFLCGHDERAWFAAAVPERSGASTVRTAKEALKPAAARGSQFRHRVKPKDRNRRRNAGFVRQGEWFFIPAPDLEPSPMLVLSKEPLSRGRGKPHLAELLYRRGGTTVYVCPQYPTGLTEAEYRRLIQSDPKQKSLRWTTRRRDPMVFVKGRIRHPDHKTIVLPFWHQVVPNTESRAQSMRNLAFLD